MDIWLEIVTLLIPGFNDSEEELHGLTDFLVSVSPDIPWHVTAFHKDYKMDDPDNTRPEDLLRAADIGKKAGLRYIYAGNLPGMVGDHEDTRCDSCGEMLIQRHGYFIRKYRLTPDGRCPSCRTPLPGRWAAKFEGQIADRPFSPRQRSGLVTILN
jgi:pyruvate formate lyase activating enzyme